MTENNNNKVNTPNAPATDQKRSFGGGNGKPGERRFFDKRPTDDFEEKILNIKRINKTTKGGRRMRFSALAVVGNRKGRVGFGVGKSVEAPEAIKKAIADARKNITIVPISPKGSIFHEITCKEGATKILLKPAPVGTGIIAGGPVRIIMDLAGYKDVCSKKLGANASINMIRATMKCLLSQRSPEQIAKLRGKEIKDL
ncbi:MAG: 30S ribosomal protein S5 [Mycoplasmataceae bacterium]|jgi:small subunit ribosomal protein S5|nr:30S ribosomal protein S5 [Mycoplasmataceae bacterium]